MKHYLRIKPMRDSSTGLLLSALLLLSLGAYQDIKALPPGPYQVVIQNGVRAKMRDGVQLVADIYRPRADGKFPVLLTRTPYNRKGSATDAYTLSSYGYVVILQDTRGRFDSEGEFYPFKYESHDGYDTVEWAAALDY